MDEKMVKDKAKDKNRLVQFYEQIWESLVLACRILLQRWLVPIVYSHGCVIVSSLL